MGQRSNANKRLPVDVAFTSRETCELLTRFGLIVLSVSWGLPSPPDPCPAAVFPGDDTPSGVSRRTHEAKGQNLSKSFHPALQLSDR